MAEIKKEMKQTLLAAMTEGPSGKKKETKNTKKDTKKEGEASDQHHSNKSKAVAKTGTAKSQWDIMRSLGLEDELIAKFTDA